MAGIDWLRWHHGSITDPKFQLVAKKAGVRLGDVMVVWTFLLEKASADDDRGSIGPIDYETLDYLIGGDDGDAVRICDSLSARGLITGSRIANWEKRQPKREREDDNSTERVRNYREKKRQETECNAINGDETPCNAMKRQETPRGEERREEKSKQPHSVVESGVNSPRTTPAGVICSRLRAAGISSVNPSNPRLLALINAGATDDEFFDLASEPASKGKGFSWILAAVEGRRRDAAAIGQLPQARASPHPSKSSRQASIDNYAAQAAEARGEGHGNRPARERDITGEVVRIA